MVAQRAEESDSGTGDELHQLVEELREIKRWVRVQGLVALRRILADFSRKDLIIYDGADGETGVSEIAQRAQVGTATVSRRLQKWNRMKIVEKKGRQWQHIAPLSALGMDLPES